MSVFLDSFSKLSPFTSSRFPPLFLFSIALTLLFQMTANGVGAPTPQAASLMREYAKSMTFLTQETDARVAQERAVISNLQVSSL